MMRTRLHRIAGVLFAGAALAASLASQALAELPTPILGVPNPNQSPRPAGHAIDFDVLFDVSDAALAASGTTMEELCPRITVSMSLKSDVQTVQGGHAIFLPQPNQHTGMHICEARYPRVFSYATMLLSASYAGTGAPFSIGPSSPNFYENPTTLTANETVSPITNAVYREFSVTPIGQAMPHPTNRHAPR
jgi:hypothetical protein